MRDPSTSKLPGLTAELLAPPRRSSARRVVRAAGIVAAAAWLAVVAAGGAAALSADPPRPGARPLKIEGVRCGWLCIPDAHASCGDGRPHIDGCPSLQRYFEAMPGGLAAAIGWDAREGSWTAQAPPAVAE